MYYMSYYFFKVKMIYCCIYIVKDDLLNYNFRYLDNFF